jgi:hypothetical protein
MTNDETTDGVKILFRFHSSIFDEEIVETMWAIAIDKEKGLYKMDSIPFYAPLVASEDIVFAEFDEKEQMLTFRFTVEHSGNSTIQVIILDKSMDVHEIRSQFESLGCISEHMNEGYFSMEVPSIIDYGPIKQKLDDLESKGVLSYAEPCLSQGHRKM